MLYLHRPFIAHNAEEPLLSKDHFANRSSSLQYNVYSQTQWADTVLHGEENAAADVAEGVGWHLLYGSVTVLLLVDVNLVTSTAAQVAAGDPQSSRNREMLFAKYGINTADDGPIDSSLARMPIAVDVRYLANDVNISRVDHIVQDLPLGMTNLCVIGQLSALSSVPGGTKLLMNVVAGMTGREVITIMVKSAELIKDDLRLGSIIFVTGASVEKGTSSVRTTG